MLWVLIRSVLQRHSLCIPTLQYNLSGSNPDGSIIVDDSNSFFSPYKILPVDKENKYLGIFSYFIMELYVVYSLELPHRGNSNEYTQHTIVYSLESPHQGNSNEYTQLAIIV